MVIASDNWVFLIFFLVAVYLLVTFMKDEEEKKRRKGLMHIVSGLGVIALISLFLFNITISKTQVCNPSSLILIVNFFSVFFCFFFYLVLTEPAGC